MTGTIIRARIVDTAPLVRDWPIYCGDYTDAPDIEATWFIDPPYMRGMSASGKRRRGGDIYGKFALDDKDYERLAEWILTRRGQVIVCEQNSADWLPFVPFRRQWANVASGRRSHSRMEMVFEFDQ